MCPGIFSYKRKKKRLNIIITITLKPKLINYINAPLTKTKLLKNIKIGNNIEFVFLRELTQEEEETDLKRAR